MSFGNVDLLLGLGYAAPGVIDSAWDVHIDNASCQAIR